MALEMRMALENGLQFRQAYVHVGNVGLKRTNRPVVDDDGKRVPVDDKDPKRGWRMEKAWKATARLRVYKSQSVLKEGGAPIEVRSEAFYIDISQPVLSQIYEQLKARDGYKDADNA